MQGRGVVFLSMAQRARSERRNALRRGIDVPPRCTLSTLPWYQFSARRRRRRWVAVADLKYLPQADRSRSQGLDATAGPTACAVLAGCSAMAPRSNVAERSAECGEPVGGAAGAAVSACCASGAPAIRAGAAQSLRRTRKRSPRPRRRRTKEPDRYGLPAARPCACD